VPGAETVVAAGAVAVDAGCVVDADVVEGPKENGEGLGAGAALVVAGALVLVVAVSAGLPKLKPLDDGAAAVGSAGLAALDGKEKGLELAAGAGAAVEPDDEAVVAGAPPKPENRGFCAGAGAAELEEAWAAAG
jgi:hypothetical protein